MTTNENNQVLRIIKEQRRSQILKWQFGQIGTFSPTTKLITIQIIINLSTKHRFRTKGVSWYDPALKWRIDYHHYFFMNSFSEFSGCLLWASKQKMYSACSHEAYLKRHIPTWPSHWILLRWALLTWALLTVLPQCTQDPSWSHVLHAEHKITEGVSSPQLQFHSPIFPYKWLCPLHLYWCFSRSFTQLHICSYSHIHYIWTWLA